MREGGEVDVGRVETELREVEARMDDALRSIREIEAQLGVGSKLGGDGRPMRRHDYIEWRHRAITAMQKRALEYRGLKAHSRELRANLRRARWGGADTTLAALLYGIVTSAIDSGWRPTPDQEAILERARDQLIGGARLR